MKIDTVRRVWAEKGSLLSARTILNTVAPLLQGSFQDFWDDYLIGIAFTATGSDGKPVFGKSGMDIRDCVTPQEVLNKLGKETVNQLCREAFNFYLTNYEDIMRLNASGSDFHLSRNGHGAGYFDRGDDPAWQRLQQEAKVCGPWELCE